MKPAQLRREICESMTSCNWKAGRKYINKKQQRVLIRTKV